MGYIRRNVCVPLPRVKSLDELNAKLLAKCTQYLNHQIEGRPDKVCVMLNEDPCVAISSRSSGKHCHYTTLLNRNSILVNSFVLDTGSILYIISFQSGKITPGIMWRLLMICCRGLMSGNSSSVCNVDY